MSKKSLITAASTAALVATIGFAYAQSTDEEAYNNANINGTVDNNVPKHWARDMVNSDPYDTAAPTAAGSTTSMPSEPEARADTSTSSSTATPPAADATSPWAADSTSTSANAPSPSSYDATTNTAPANTTDAVNQSNSSLSTNTAPTETHVDLNSPNDPIYNLGQDSYDSERAPRPDRN
jgi:hypothetical protein